MAFSDPIVLTISGVTWSLIKKSTQGQNTFYSLANADEEFVVTVRHNVRPAKGVNPLIRRANIEVVHNYFKSGMTPYTKKFYIVAEAGVAQSADSASGFALMTWLLASSGANLSKLLGGES